MCIVRTTRKDQNRSVVPSLAESRGQCFHLALRRAIQIQIDEPCTAILTVSNAPLQLCCSSSPFLSRSPSLLVPMTFTRIGRPRTASPAATTRIAAPRVLAKWKGDCRFSMKVNGSTFLVMPFGPTRRLMVWLMFVSSRAAFCALWVAWERSSTWVVGTATLRATYPIAPTASTWIGTHGQGLGQGLGQPINPELVISSSDGGVCRSLTDPRSLQERQRSSILS